jgi:acetyl-CoA synthetase
VGDLAPAATATGDPAVLLYTAGPAGGVRGVLHAHRALPGNMPAVAAQHGGLGREGDLAWTPTDWAWRSALFDALLPALFAGVPVVAHAMARFDPGAAFDIMARHGVRNAVLPAAALRAMRAARPAGPAPRLRSIGSSADPPDAALAAWAQAALGATPRHAPGRAECNLILTGCEGPLPAGRAVPGHAVAVIDPEGRPLSPWETGLLAVRRPHPGLFLGYWRDPAATARMLAGPWMPTGDQAALGEDGAVLLPARDEAAAATSGEGMGPEDVEHCLLRHPAVAMAAIIGPADPLAEDHATAVIVPRGDATTGPELAEELRGFMRARLFGHRYPRRVAFAQTLPRMLGGQVAEKALGTAVGLGARRPGAR